MVAQSLRILILEDRSIDAELVQYELQEAGLAFTSNVVMTEKEYIQALQEFPPDLILSDYDLPQYNGALALAEARRRCPDTPFILVTGAVGEDRAIEILTQGAKDYVLKSRLQQRLVPAVRRALAEAEEQKARKKAEEELREAHRNLESQVAERTAELQKQIEHRRQIEEALLKYNERLELLTYTAGRLLASETPQQLVKELCLKVMEFLDCDAFFNFLVDEAAGRLHLNACAGIPEETAREIEWLDYGVAVCGCAARDGCRIVAENIPVTPDVRTELVKSFGIKAYACHPLMKQNRVMGTLSFGTRSRTTFSTDDLAMMKAVADQVAITMVRVRTEDALRTALAKAAEGDHILDTLMEYIPEGITIADAPDVKIRMVSRYGREILGGAHDRMTAEAVADQWLVYDKDGTTPMAPADLPLSRAILQGETVINKELVLINTKGHAIPLLCNAAPIRDHAGTITGGIVAWRDISERKQAEAKLHRYELLADRHRDVILFIGLDDGRILEANDAATRAYGYRYEELLDLTIHDLRAADTPGLTADQIAIAFDQGLLFEMVHRCQDGSTFPVEVSTQGAEIGGRRILISVVRDITERKRIARELSERTAALEERTRQMEAANKELESFSYSVSHDLRAPLRAIDGYSRMILRQQGDTFDENTRRQFNRIMDSARMMGQLIDDLLALSRLGREALSLSRLNVVDLTRDVWQELKANNPDRPVDLKIDPVPPGMGDRSLIKQVLVNILSNAIKFTRVREAPLVEVGGYGTETENVYYVRDNGVGFDMQYHDKLFGVFQRLHSVDDYEGTGVGLAIVQRIIHRHGGRVWAESKIDEGACFYFTLPTG